MNRVRFASAILAIALAACTTDKVVAPPPLTDPPYPALYAKAIRSAEFLIADLEARRRDALPGMTSRYDADIRAARRKLAAWKAAGRIAADSANPRFLSAPRDGEEPGAEEAGIIDVENTWTRVYPRDRAVIYVQTVVTWPATEITHKTGGKFITRGSEFPINATWTDFGWDAFQTIWLDGVKCHLNGAKIDASTWHEAFWGVRWAKISMDGHLSTGNDNGECPPVPPTARLWMTHGASSAREDDILTIRVPQGGSAEVSLDGSISAHDAPITNYSWYANGDLIGTGPRISYTAHQNQTGISLVVMDENRLTGTAGGTIALDYGQDECSNAAGDDNGDEPPGDDLSIAPAWPPRLFMAAPATTRGSLPGGPSLSSTPAGSCTTEADRYYPADVWSGTDVWFVCERVSYWTRVGDGPWQYTRTAYENCRIESA
jgi:hypothetical protein